MASTAILDVCASVTFDDYLIDCAWSADGAQLAAIGGEGRVFAASFAAKRLTPRALGEHAMGALALAFRPGSSIFATSGQDNAVALWDAVSGAELARWRPARSWTDHLAFSPSGRELATSAGRQLFLWSAEGAALHRFEPHAGTIAALGWDKPGRDLAVAINGGLFLHRMTDDRQVGAMRAFAWPAPCVTVAFSPNGRVLATGTQDGSVHFWYLNNARDSQMRGYPGKVDQTCWNSAGRYLATNAGNEIVVWDFGGKGPEGSKPQQLSGHTERVERLAWQPNGGYLISVGLDWRVSLWQPGKAKLAVDAHLTDAEPSCVSWSADGRFVAVGERKGKLTVYELVQVPA